MPDITLPEVKLPDIKLPDGLRDMNRRDIQNALSDRMPKKVEMPDVDLSKVGSAEGDDRLEALQKSVDSTGSKDLDLPKAVEDRLPGAGRIRSCRSPRSSRSSPRSRRPWWLITSPTAAVKVRDTADRTWRKVTGQKTDLVRRDDEATSPAC